MSCPRGNGFDSSKPEIIARAAFSRTAATCTPRNFARPSIASAANCLAFSSAATTYATKAMNNSVRARVSRSWSSTEQDQKPPTFMMSAIRFGRPTPRCTVSGRSSIVLVPRTATAVTSRRPLLLCFETGTLSRGRRYSYPFPTEHHVHPHVSPNIGRLPCWNESRRTAESPGGISAPGSQQRRSRGFVSNRTGRWNVDRLQPARRSPGAAQLERHRIRLPRQKNEKPRFRDPHAHRRPGPRCSGFCLRANISWRRPAFPIVWILPGRKNRLPVALGRNDERAADFALVTRSLVLV